jgi:2-dehydropantoate 2-reductase
MTLKIAFIGAGGVGGYFGGHLARAGTEVHFIARGAHLAALKAKGLTVLSDLAPIAGLPVMATDDPASVGPVDAMFLAVKLADTEGALAQMGPLIGPETVVASLQNGVDAVERMVAAFGPAQVLGGVCHIATAVDGPGVIRHTGTMAKVTLGELAGGASARLSRLVEAFRTAGLDIVESPDIRRAIWEKFVFLSAFSGVTALSRSAIGPIRTDATGRLFIARALAESAAVARAKGVALAEDHVEKALGFVDRLPATMKASMLHDLERGAKLELPWLSGAVVRLGREADVPVPTHETIVAALTPHQGGRPT